MTTARPSDFWFSNTALYIQLNAVGDCNYIHANCSSGSMVMAYMKGIIPYDNAHNYKRWTLIASPTHFPDNNPKYVYIRIPKSNASDANAEVVFPSEVLDVYGCNESGKQVGSSLFFYINTGGIISAPKSSSSGLRREWQGHMNTGMLASDEATASGGANSWWEWNAVTDLVTFTKQIAEAAILKLTAPWAAITQLVLNGKSLNNVAGDDTDEDATDAVATPDYVAKHYLSKKHDDVAAGNIIFNNNITVKGETILKENVCIGDFAKDAQVGIGAREGVNISPQGDIVARSLELSESLNVPSIKYNQIEVLSGTRWDSAAKGRVKEIISINEADHTCTFVLDLNHGEPGEFIKDDILRGFWHDVNGEKNAEKNIDDRHGNIQRAGFMSIYAHVVSVGDVVERVTDNATLYVAKDEHYTPQDGDNILIDGLVKVQMRQFTDSQTWSPYPEKWSVLSQSGSFSMDPAHDDRKRFSVYTTSYIARFENVNTWEWEDGTFKGGWGDLTGFAMAEVNEKGEVFHRVFKGSGFVDENVYIYGVIEQFYRFSDSLRVKLSRADGTIAEGETLTAQFSLHDIQDNLVVDGYKLTISRQSGNAKLDGDWDALMKQKYPNSIPISLSLSIDDVPENGAVFIVASSRSVSDTTGGVTTITTSSSFTLSRVYLQESFMGEWEVAKDYRRDNRSYPTVTHYGCKWFLKVDNANSSEPLPYSSVWGLVYGVEDLTIVFYNKAGQKVSHASCYPGSVYIYLAPRLFCGNIDITSLTSDNDWAWARYTGSYGEDIDSRPLADKQADMGWPKAHPAKRVITITNDDMPPLWGSDGKLVNFIVSVNFDGEQITNTVSL